MSNRRILIAAGLVALAVLVIVLGLQAGLAPRPRATLPAGTAGLWWPTPSGDWGRAGGPSNPQLTTLPFNATLTAAVQQALGLPTRTAIGAAASGPTLTPSLTTTPRSETGEQAEPSPTIDPLACLPPDALEDPGGDVLPVSWVRDGGSFVVERQGAFQTVRLLGVEAAPIAARKLEELIGNQIVRLVPDARGPDTDAHGQLLRYVFTLDGHFINLELIRLGQARLDATAGESACQAQFDQAVTQAQTAEIGLWAAQAAAQLPTQTRVPTPTGGQTAVALLLTPSATLQATTLSGTPGTATPTITGTPPTATPTVTGTPPTATVTATSSSGQPVLPTNTVGPAATATATASGEGYTDAQVAIINIFTIGTASKNESDEYIELKNTSSTPADLTGWSLWSEETYAEVYWLETFILQPGQVCRVYTNETHPDSCGGITFGQEFEAWDNEEGCGGLYNVDEVEMAGYCYPPD